MSLVELQTLACDSTGNVVNMETLEERGSSGGVTLKELQCPQAAESSGVYHRPELYCGPYCGLRCGAVPRGCTGC